MFVENDKLEQTQFTQPAILLVSLVAKELLSREIEIQPTYLLGHSLGEFSALASSGALNIIDAVKLVNRRGELMSEACADIDAGMMAVIGVSNESVEKICEEARVEGKKVWGANYNSDGQVVIAGIKSDLEYIQPKLKEAKAKRAIILNMSVASHCELLDSATGELNELMKSLISENFSAPIISNVTAEEYSSKDAAVELLTKQLVSPVKYEESIQYLADKVDLFIEFGHGSVLKGLNRRIVKSIPTLNISDMDSLQKAIAELQE
jgi:[acyl-carrier-protein] S-malonyltransferase